MAVVCTEITEWIEEEISKPIEEWEERQEKKCKDYPWYDPRGWVCWFVTYFVKVIRWVVVTVVTAVITVVCRLVSGLLSILWNALKFFGNLLKALVTWDKCALQAALGNGADALVGAFSLVGDAIIKPVITDPIQTFRLRRHVGEEIDKRFSNQPELAETIKKKFNVDAGVFGYPLTVGLHRMFVDSETRTPQSGDVPNLVFLHETGQINLFELAGFDRSCAIFSKDGWRRSLPRTAKKTFAGGGGAVIETDPPEITRDELTEYIDSRGTKGPRFLILAMSTRMQKSRIEAAETKGREIGLLLTFDAKLKEVTDPAFLNYREAGFAPLPVDCQTKAKGQEDYLICELGRRPKNDFLCCDADRQPTPVVGSMTDALGDLCAPVAVGIFRYTKNQFSGYTDNLIGTTGQDHDLPASVTSGVSFRAQIPNEVRKWVLIHELGHYFSLTHVDGFDRLMVAGTEGQGSLWSWQAVPNFLWHGGPRFTHTEAERVWDFIITNFPTECLAPPVIL